MAESQQAVEGLEGFFDEIIKLLSDSERQYGVADQRYAEYIIERFEICINTCLDVVGHIQAEASESADLRDYCSTLRELIGCLEKSLEKWFSYNDGLESGHYMQHSSSSYQLPQHHIEHSPGRPKFDIKREQLLYLSSLSFNWTEIAALLGVSRMTIYRRRVEYGLLEEPTSELSDEDMRSLLKQIREDMPYSGVSMIWGNLRSKGYKVTRERVRNALRAIDPLSVTSRWPGHIKRRPYSVPGPNSLWHIDTHHKLIRWRMVTHGGIDGYSRLILYLKCASNNKASTTYEQFLLAVHKHQLPSRVRSDQGGENVLVAQYMIERRGADRRSMITGSSVHNQRIERLWRDMHCGVTILYYRLFYFMEQDGILNPLNEKHLWAVHYIFLPRVNRALSQFVDSWNNHPIRTAHCKSPQQLFTAGSLLLQHSGLSAMDFFELVDDGYGIDSDGPSHPVSNEESVIVPDSQISVLQQDLAILSQNIDPLSASENYGIDLYEQTVQFLDSLSYLH